MVYMGMIASVICSDVSVRNVCIDRMVGKFKDSGYTAKELLVPAERARSQVQQRLLENQGDKTSQKDDIITMIINKDCGLKKVLNSFFESVKEEFTAIVGEKRILVAIAKYRSVSIHSYAVHAQSQKLPNECI